MPYAVVVIGIVSSRGNLLIAVRVKRRPKHAVREASGLPYSMTGT